jgi:hypothetical protein
VVEPVIEVTSAPLAWGAKVSATFRDRVRWIASTLTTYQGVPFAGSNAMACMAWESGETFSASVKNMAGSGAVGLIQFMPDVAKELNTTTGALAVMTAEDQLNYVYKYFKMWIDRRGALATLEDMYMSILWPGAIGKDPAYPIFDSKKSATAYRQNAGLDINKDGIVTKYECAAKVRGELTKGLRYAA